MSLRWYDVDHEPVVREARISSDWICNTCDNVLPFSIPVTALDIGEELRRLEKQD